MPSKGDGVGIDTLDRTVPTGNFATRSTGNAFEDWQRLR